MHGGDYFSSGNDLGAFMRASGDFEEMTKLAEYSVMTVLVGMLTALIDLKKPLVALVKGASYGISCTMLGLADFIYCSPDAYFCTPFMETV